MLGHQQVSQCEPLNEHHRYGISEPKAHSCTLLTARQNFCTRLGSPKPKMGLLVTGNTLSSLTSLFFQLNRTDGRQFRFCSRREVVFLDLPAPEIQFFFLPQPSLPLCRSSTSE
ncbi:hypothetical protein TNCV_206751 [Trichonephila clavipes]|nr:hypothetical protein TNCV_206751 [Trichonephila clavipes]